MADTKAADTKPTDKPKASEPQERARTAEGAEALSAGQQARRNPAESGDPAVHQLLAERQTAQMNGDDAAMQRVDDKLHQLGF